MKGFQLDSNGDLVITSGDIQIAQGIDLLSQKIACILRTNKGEWWLNPNEGIPLQKILKKNPNLSMIKDYVRKAIKQVDDTLQMTACDITQSGRNLSVKFTVKSGKGSKSAEMDLEV